MESTESTWMLKDILSRGFRSISWMQKPEVPEVNFEYNRRLDLFAGDAWKIAKGVAAGFPNKAARKPIPVCHATFHDGSEQDLWAHLATYGDAVLLLEVSHSYIDQHFVNFKLWDTDQGGTHDYPVDDLFVEDVLKEKPADRSKIGEMNVRPVAITIHAFKFDVSRLMPDESECKELSASVEGFPLYKFWEFFQAKNYIGADKVLSGFLEYPSTQGDAPDGYKSFIRSLVAICKYLSNDFEAAADSFVLSGKDYGDLKLHRNADICFFWAIERGKKIPDLNKAFQIAQKVVDCLRFLDSDSKSEVTGIIKSYYSSVYIGTAVLCRRIIELTISAKMEKQFGVPIKKQVQTAKKNGEIDKSIGPGLYGVLELAKLRSVISGKEHTLASSIKDFGNNIHETGGIKNTLDAKYAVQACLHLVNRL
jgi:hypothetical protein